MTIESATGLCTIMFINSRIFVLPKTITMEHKKELEELYRQKKEKIDAYLKTKNIKPEDRKKHDEALSEWEKAWAKYMDVIMYLETLEI
jgi:hypothetical protein